MLLTVCNAVGILLPTDRTDEREQPSVAIIGAGIGGASAAHFLSELVKQKIHIDLYEAGTVGGRMATTEINNETFEIGASVIHSRNRYMDSFCVKYGMSKLEEDDDGVIALYDGKEFPYIGSHWELITLIKLIWRYGRSLNRAFNLVENMLEKFDRIYDWQESMKTFDDMKSLISAMSPTFVEYLNKTSREGFLEHNINEKFIDEIVMASTKCNYGQGTDIHQFVGSVSLAGIQSGLWSVDGGNKLIVHRLVNDSRAVLKFEEVTGVILKPDETFIVETDKTSRLYDVVIVATPITKDAKLPITFLGFPNEIKVTGKYHRTVATIVHGKVNYTYFGYTEEDSLPDLIMSIGNTFFNSLGSILPVKSSAEKKRKLVWKVFSSAPLEEHELDALFLERYETQVFDWLAYPHYTAYDVHKTNDTFVLHKNLFYVSAVEWAASAMEMGAISGKNAALLTYKTLFPYEYSRRQSVESVEEVHDEL